MPRPFVVIETRRPASYDARPMDDHAAFVDSLVAERFVLLGESLEGTRDVVLVIQAEDDSEIMIRLAGDPWIRQSGLSLKECRPWRIRLRTLG